MMRFVNPYLPSYPVVIAYMLQSVEYEFAPYIKWLYAAGLSNNVMRRRTLDHTSIARLIVLFLRICIMSQLAIGAMYTIWNIVSGSLVHVVLGLIIILSAPFIWCHLIVLPVIIAKRLLINPKLQKQKVETERLLSRHSALKIAVAGSYGKTTMKELLYTVLSEGKKVACTPGNKNVATAHYEFAKSLDGDEDVLIIELGEGKPGDVESFSRTIKPDIAIITGLAPAHLDHYASMEDAGKDIFSLTEVVEAGNIYVNIESATTKSFVKNGYNAFDQKGVSGWKTDDIRVGIEGTSFKLKKKNKTVVLRSGLLGAHLVGVLSVAVAVGESLGLAIDQVEAGISKTKPYEHRMQPYGLNGAWVIDDSYNGNLEGIRAGTKLLGQLEAHRRKIYVTPGLVDQGSDTKATHIELGKLVADASPDIVVLMRNSVTNFIQIGLEDGGYNGKVIVQDDPLKFYTNLNQFVVSGDIIMLQNDWTDNYQ